MYTPRPLINLAVGYTADSKNPTEEHINQALVETFRMPVCQYVHNRVWLPHRQGMDMRKVWQYIHEHTSAALAQEPSSGPITNCGHVAFFTIAPEDQETLRDADAMRYIHYQSEYFKDGLFKGEHKVADHEHFTWWARTWATQAYPGAMCYARELHTLGYDVGFLGCIISSPNAFNEIFGEYLPEGPVHPIMMVFAGTKASALRNSGTRLGVDTSTVADKAHIKVPWQKIQREAGATRDDSFGLCKWNADRTELVPLTEQEVKDLNYVKFSKTFLERKDGNKDSESF